MEISNIRTKIKEGKPVIVKNKTKGTEFEVEYTLSDRQKEIILAGGTLAFMKNKSQVKMV